MVIISLIALTITSVLISTSNDVVLSGTVTNSTAMEFLTNGLISLLIFLGIGIIVFIVHELIHLLFIPNSFKSDSVYINLTCFGEGVHTTDELSKNRVCLMYIAPFVFLSVVLNVILGIMGLYSIPVMIFIFLNSIGCSEDILELIFILSQVPKNAKIVNNGVHTYFRVDPKIIVTSINLEFGIVY
jgi:hypothetical protein